MTQATQVIPEIFFYINILKLHMTQSMKHIYSDCPCDEAPPLKSTWVATASNVKNDDMENFGPQLAIDSIDYEGPGVGMSKKYFHTSTDWQVEVDNIWLQV